MGSHGGVDEDVDAPERSDDLLDHRVDFGALAQIDGERQRPPPPLPHFFRSDVGIGLFKIRAGDVATLSGKSGHDGGTKFAIAARNDRYFPFKFHGLIGPAASRSLLAVRNSFS